MIATVFLKAKAPLLKHQGKKNERKNGCSGFGDHEATRQKKKTNNKKNGTCKIVWRTKNLDHNNPKKCVAKKCSNKKALPSRLYLFFILTC